MGLDLIACLAVRGPHARRPRSLRWQRLRPLPTTRGVVTITIDTEQLSVDFDGDPSMRLVIGQVVRAVAGGADGAERGELRISSAEPTAAALVVTVESDAKVWTVSVRHDTGAPLRFMTPVLITSRLQKLLASWAGDPEQPASRLVMLSPEERDQILYAWNDTDADVPPLGVVELFRQHVALTPDRVAVVSDRGSLTFAELDARSTAVAGVLRRSGVRRDFGAFARFITSRAARSKLLVKPLAGDPQERGHLRSARRGAAGSADRADPRRGTTEGDRR